MYDKSKKTWSQRLKITKTEKITAISSSSTTTTTTSALAAPSTPPAGSANNAHTFGRSTASHYHTAAMHLPTLQLQQLNDYHNAGEYLPSALSRSMKYAEPWIYGTVRGIPARPYHHYEHQGVASPSYGHPHAAAIFAAHPLAATGGTAEALAVVICSCPEYLNGTKREVKKASICKKCKGSRLPLAPMGGTMRLPAATAGGLFAASKLRSGAATVRVVSTNKKSRPTILDPKMDPYDLMRRTRLLSPEPGGSNGREENGSAKEKTRNRGKSASPVRGRSRKRSQLALAPPKKQNSNKKDNDVAADLPDCWLVDDTETLLNASTDGTATAQSPGNSARRSILRCNVNPYDLISITTDQTNGNRAKVTTPSTPKSHLTLASSRGSSQNEFFAPNDDFNVEDAALNEEAPPFAMCGNSSPTLSSASNINQHTTLPKAAKNGTANKARRSSSFERGSKKEPDSPKPADAASKNSYSNVKAIAGQRISLGERRSSKQALIKQSEDGRCYESIIITSPPPQADEVKERVIEADKMSKKAQTNKQTRPQQLELHKADEERKRRMASTPPTESPPPPPTPTRATSPAQPKRPPRVRKLDTGESVENEGESVESVENEESVTVLTVTPTQHIKSILKRPSSKNSDCGENANTEEGRDLSAASETIKSTATPTNQQRVSSLTGHNSNSGVNSTTATSQFYIPLPQAARKKVQFMVEERVVHALDNIEAADDESNESTSSEKSAESASMAHNDTDEHEAMQTQTRKSTANYEYYNRKREQQRLLRQRNAHNPAAATMSADCDSPMGTAAVAQTQAVLLSELQHESDLVSHALNALEEVHSGNSEEQTGSSSVGNKVYVDAEDLPAGGKTSEIMHYEDVIPAAVMVNTQQQQMHKQQNQQLGKSGSNTANISGNKIMSDTTAKLLPTQRHGGGSQAQIASSSSTATAPTTTTVRGAALTPAATQSTTLTATASPRSPPHQQSTKEVKADNVGRDDVAQQHVNNDDDNVDCRHDDNTTADDVLKAEHATPTRTTIATTTPQAHDYDADVATQLKAAAVTAAAAAAVNDNKSRATQSRTNIRRSHSERHPTATLTNNNNNNRQHNAATTTRQQQNGTANNGRRRSSDNANNNSSNRNAIVNFHDTMALRDRTSHNDSRDLFARQTTAASTATAATSGTMSRPREPPPPPPTPPPLSSAEAATKPADATAAKQRDPVTSVEKLKSLSVAPKAQTETEVEAVDKGKNAAKATKVGENAKIAGQALDEQQRKQTNAKQQQQLLHKGASCQVADNGKANATFTNKDMQQMAATKPQQQQGNNGAWNTTMRPITMPTSSHNSNNNNNKSKSTSSYNTPQQRTVVRVAPYHTLTTTSEVHRLKISHTDAEPTASYQAASSSSAGYSFQYSANGSTFSDATQKKTSILINGDDCYSTMNLSCDDASTPLYQSSVVVADYSASSSSASSSAAVLAASAGLKVTNTSNTVTINVSSPRSAAEELIYQHNKINTLLSRQARENGSSTGRAIIPIRGTPEVHLQRSASSTSSTSTNSMTSISSSGSGSGSGSGGSIPKRGRTLIRLDYEHEKTLPQVKNNNETPKAETTTSATATSTATTSRSTTNEAETPSSPLSHEDELLKLLRNPVEAVKRNLVPHVCGRNDAPSDAEHIRSKKMKETATLSSSHTTPTLITTSVDDVAEPKSEKTEPSIPEVSSSTPRKTPERSSSFIAKLLEDPMLSQVADGLETETVAELIENSLKRLQESRSAIDMSGTKDNDDMNRLINMSLQKIKEERQNNTTTPSSSSTHLSVPTKDEDRHSNRGSISSATSFASANNYEMFDFDANESDCYQSCSSEITTPGDDDGSSAATRSKFYQMLVDATLAEIEMSTNLEEDLDSHHYESIRNNGDPIYEEISDVPPPLPLTAPPLNDADMDKKGARSIFEGASKYDILSYLVDAKERGVVREEPFDYPLNCSNPIIIEEEAGDTLSDLGKRKQKRDMSSRASILSDSSEDTQSVMSSLSPPPNSFLNYSGSGSGLSLLQRKGASSDIERNDSGVGSETSKSSRSKYQNPLATGNAQLSKNSPIHLCEDCDGPVETQVTDSGIMFAPLVCRKCGKKRVERKEIITEIVETEEKYGRDLQIILEEFCHPMLVAGLLTQEQLSAIFLNTEELLENNQTLAERMRDALDIALEQGDDDLLTVNIGKIFLDFTQMLHAFESYCVRQAGASLLLANLEKEKELLRIFLKVSQMENAVLRRMNLNSFLMVPVQRVTKYPLLLARLYKVTPAHLEGRDQLKQAQEKIELHLNHINQEAKDVPTKLWRRISSSSPNRRASCEIDMINIKLRKMAIDILEWNHDEVRFAMEGKLLYTQPTDSNWKKARTIKLTPVNALLVTNGKPSANYKAEKVMSDKLNFPKHTGIREASLLVVKEKCGRYTLIREPLYLDRCVVCSEADWDDYFEVQEISSKDTFIFKAEDGVRTKQWYTQLQYHAQGMGAWRKRRNALANIMINGMLTRT